VRWKLITVNPMAAVQLPKLEKQEAIALEASQLAWYMEAARAGGLYEILKFAAATGCRRGEILALAWPDVDLINRIVRVTKSVEQTKAGLRIKTPKNMKPRPVSLPPSMVPILELHRTNQQENRRLFGQDYRGDLNLVFCGPQGDYLKPDSISAKASLIAKQAGLKDTSLHTLRHSHGSQLLSAGVPLPTVSKRLGHSSVYVTATVYSHALGKDELAAGDAWDASVEKALMAEANAKIT